MQNSTEQASSRSHQKDRDEYWKISVLMESVGLVGEMATKQSENTERGLRT